MTGVYVAQHSLASAEVAVGIWKTVAIIPYMDPLVILQLKDATAFTKFGYNGTIPTSAALKGGYNNPLNMWSSNPLMWYWMPVKKP